MKTQDLRTFRSALIVATLLLAVCPLGLTQNPANSTTVSMPHLIKFSGVLKDEAGAPKTGVAGITFALYKDQQGGTPLWLETQNVQADANGHYTVMLGATKSDGLPMEFFTSNEARWVGVQPQGQSEQPRVLLVSAPYALKAADAETLGGKPLSAFQLVAPSSNPNSGATQQAQPPAEQPNEISCASKTGCQAAFVPLFTTNGGSAKVSDSIITQTGSTVNVGGEVVGQTGFFRSATNGTIFQATQTSNGGGVALGGVAEGTTGIGVAGSGVTGVSGFGLSNGTGVSGQGGTGIFGFSSPTSGFARATVGILNTTTAGSAAVYGLAQNTSGQTFGVQGYNFANTDFAAGVSGVADGDQNKTFGVTGQSFSPAGTGVWGLGQGQSATGGLVGCCSVGVWGDTSSNAGGAAGLVGTADDAQALFLGNNSTNFLTAAINNFENSQHNVAMLLVQDPAFGQFCNINTDGVLFCSGGHALVVPVDNSRRQVALHAVESPQNWFEDFGSGRLESGVGTIALEPTFAQTVNTGSDYHVFLTPEGECRGLYVSNKSASGFEVHEVGGGQSNVAFAYRIVALRRGYENLRLARGSDRDGGEDERQRAPAVCETGSALDVARASYAIHSPSYPGEPAGCSAQQVGIAPISKLIVRQTARGVGAPRAMSWAELVLRRREYGLPLEDSFKN